jgi:hypothetical protein
LVKRGKIEDIGGMSGNTLVLILALQVLRIFTLLNQTLCSE